MPSFKVAGWTRLELVTSGLTGRRSNQLNYQPPIAYFTREQLTKWAL
jgi:hypothetical protein